MHLLATSTATLDDLIEPIDLAQQPAEMVVLSFSDSDLSAVAAAWRAQADDMPTLRLAALRDLRHPMSVDLWLDGAGGAAKVVAVDVGHGQLAKEVAADPRVRMIEGMNAKDITRDLVPERISFIVADLSFIGLQKALPPSLALAEPGATLVALIKPQFEAGPENVGRGGIVRDEALRRKICDEIAAWLEHEAGWRVLGLTESPIEGGDGNVEFLIAARHDK